MTLILYAAHTIWAICSKFNLQFLSVAAHSWLACSDYGEKNAAYYDHSKCRGWPRKAAQYAPIGSTFGGDTGYDTRSGIHRPFYRPYTQISGPER